MDMICSQHQELLFILDNNLNQKNVLSCLCNFFLKKLMVSYFSMTLIFVNAIISLMQYQIYWDLWTDYLSAFVIVLFSFTAKYLISLKTKTKFLWVHREETRILLPHNWTLEGGNGKKIWETEAFREKNLSIICSSSFGERNREEQSSST